MRNFNPQRHSYTVDIAPAAWRQLGAVPGEVFQRIRRELDVRADLAMQRPPPSLESLMDSSVPAPLSFFVESFVVLYEVDDDRQVVTLLEVSQQLPLEE